MPLLSMETKCSILISDSRSAKLLDHLSTLISCVLLYSRVMHQWVFDHCDTVGFEHVSHVLFRLLAARFRRFWQQLSHYFRTSSPGRPIVGCNLYFPCVSRPYVLPVSQFCGGLALLSLGSRRYCFPLCDDIDMVSIWLSVSFSSYFFLMLCFVYFGSISSYMAFVIVFCW